MGLPLQLQFFVLLFASWLHREQQDVIDYLREENRVLLKLLGPQDRRRLTDLQRAHLARKAKVLGHRALAGVCGIVTPETLLRWYRGLVAEKHTATKRAERDDPQPETSTATSSRAGAPAVAGPSSRSAPSGSPASTGPGSRARPDRHGPPERDSGPRPLLTEPERRAPGRPESAWAWRSVRASARSGAPRDLCGVDRTPLAPSRAGLGRLPWDGGIRRRAPDLPWDGGHPPRPDGGSARRCSSARRPRASSSRIAPLPPLPRRKS